MITFDNLIIPTLKILYEMNKEMSIKEIDKVLIAYVGENACNLSCTIVNKRNFPIGQLGQEHT